MFIVIIHLQIQDILERVHEQVLGLCPCRVVSKIPNSALATAPTEHGRWCPEGKEHARIILTLCPGELTTATNRKSDIGIDGTATNVRSRETAPGVHCDLDDTNGSIERLAREHLL
jgi:hypothetical protein